MSTLTNQELIEKLAEKLKQARINMELTQQDVASRAGVNINTLRQLEAGKNSSLITLVAVLKVLKLENEVLSAIPDPEITPLQALKYKTKERKRVRKKG